MKYFLLSFLIVFIFSPAWAEVRSLPNDIDHISNDAGDSNYSYYCQAEQMNVQFLCDPDWEVEVFDDGTMLIVISSDPSVTLTLVKENSATIILSDLKRDVLQEIGQYRPDFSINKIEVAHRDAINVEALSQEDDTIRLSDFYLTRGGALFTFMFAISPDEHFSQYVPIIFNIINSVEFLDEI